MIKQSKPSYYAPGGEFTQKLDAMIPARVEAENATTAAQNKHMLNALMYFGLAGAGAGITGTKLYNIVNMFNKPKEKYKKFGPSGPYEPDAEEKVAEDAPPPPPAPVPPPDKLPPLSQNQLALFLPASLLAAGLGIYGGHKLVRAVEDKKRKGDTELMLEEAKNEYQRALTGKRAEALNTAFSKISAAREKAAVNTGNLGMDIIGTVYDYAFQPLRAAGLLPIYSAAVLGTGLLSGKMTYDWTRDRGKDKALDRARRSRARMEGVAPAYISPAQLEAIKALHDKEIEKARK